MRRLLLAGIVAAGFSATASAQWNPPPAPQGPPSTNMYGWNKKWIWWKRDACNTGCGSGHCGPGGWGGNNPGGPGYMGPPQGGTLVFPNHPYMRSPRDFFMWEAR